MEEIKRAVSGCERNKTPSLDGLSMAFFQDYWDLIKGELEGVFKEFFERGILNQSMAKAFL